MGRFAAYGRHAETLNRNRFSLHGKSEVGDHSIDLITNFDYKFWGAVSLLLDQTIHQLLWHHACGLGLDEGSQWPVGELKVGFRSQTGC